MNNFLVRIIKMAIVTIIIILVISFTVLSNDLKRSRNITQTDVLSGQRIGVMSGWESDYFLSVRDDINLKRYDTTAELFMALNYKQVDAVAVDAATLMLAQGSISGLETVGGPFATTQYTTYVKKGDEKTLKEINDFIEAFKKSDEYPTFVEHFYDLDWIKSGQLSEQTGTGEEIAIAYITDYYPFEFITENGTPAGSEIEFAIQFANYYNYRIKWVESTANTAFLDLTSEKAKFIMCSGTDAYRAETLNENSLASMSDGYIDSNIYCVVTKGEVTVMNTDFYGE